MRIDEALELQPGDRVASSRDTPAWRIRTIRKKPSGVWVNADRTDVRIVIPSYANGEWVSPFGFAPVPKRASSFDETARRWCRKSTKADGNHPPPFIHIGAPVPADACSPEPAPSSETPSAI